MWCRITGVAASSSRGSLLSAVRLESPSLHQPDRRRRRFCSFSLFLAAAVFVASAWQLAWFCSSCFALEATVPSRTKSPKLVLNSLVTKHLRRNLLSGDIVYTSRENEAGVEAVVRVRALEDGEPLEFRGQGVTEKEAGNAAAAAALASLPEPPEFTPKYAKPCDAGAELGQRLAAGEREIELSYVMSYLPEMMASIPENLTAVARFSLDDESPCKVLILRGTEIKRPRSKTRIVKVGCQTPAGKLAQSMRCRVLGEDNDGPYEHLEMQFNGKKAAKTAAIAIKLLQRHLPTEVSERLLFAVRFRSFPGIRSQRRSLVAHVDFV